MNAKLRLPGGLTERGELIWHGVTIFLCNRVHLCYVWA